MADPKDMQRAIDEFIRRSKGGSGPAPTPTPSPSTAPVIPEFRPQAKKTATGDGLPGIDADFLRDRQIQAPVGGTPFIDWLLPGDESRAKRREQFKSVTGFEDAGEVLEHGFGLLGEGAIQIGKSIVNPTRLLPFTYDDGFQFGIATRREIEALKEEFRDKNGRDPTQQELLELRKATTPLPPGVRGGIELATSAMIPSAVALKARMAGTPWAAGGKLRRAGAYALEPLAGMEEIAGAAFQFAGRGIQAGGAKALQRFGVANPSELGRNILGLRPIQVGLTKTEELTEIFLNTIGKPFGRIADHPLVTRIFAMRTEAMPRVVNQAAVIGSRYEAAVNFQFTRNAKGQIPELIGIDDTLKGAPTISDLAARLPKFWAALSTGQKKVMTDIREVLAPYRKLLDELGHDVGNRPDVMPGGFYISRGNAMVEGADEAKKVVASRFRPGGKKSFEEPTRYGSMAEGIADGKTYASLNEALSSYAEDAGTRAVERHAANAFITAVDDEGIPFATTAADRVSPFLRALVANTRAKIASRRNTLRKQTVRGAAAGRETDRAAKVVEKAEELTESAAQRFEMSYLGSSTDDVIKAAERELNILLRVERKAGARLRGAQRRQAAQEVRREMTGVKYDELREEMIDLSSQWKRAKALAAKNPSDAGAIDMSMLRNYAFPDEIANAANKILKKERAGPLLGDYVAFLNNIYRGIRATADNSAVGLQGLLGWANSSGASMKALRVNIDAWGSGGEAALGKFLFGFDEEAVEFGLPNSLEWARMALRIGGDKTEMMLGSGVSSKLAQMPGIRNANRAFGYYGDSLRLGWAQQELLDVMAKAGRALTRDERERAMASIAKAINGATGWSERRTFSTLGDLLFFAPRFLQSRLETLGRAAAVQGSPLEQRIARRSLLRLFGLATVLTVSANHMMGEETDFRLIVNGRKNNNFMRIRWDGRDWSLLGTWDSIAGVIIDVGAGKPQDALRSIGSGAVSNAWDFMTGSTAIGERTRDTKGQAIKRIAENFVPFSAGELPGIVKGAGQAALEGRPAGVVGGAVAVTGEISGVKSSPLSPSDKIAVARADVIRSNPEFAKRILDDQGVEVEDGDVVSTAVRLITRRSYDVSSDILLEIDKNAQVEKALGERATQQTERQSAFRLYQNEASNIDKEQGGTINDAATKLGPGRQFREVYEKQQTIRVAKKQQLREDNVKALEWLDDREPSTSKFNRSLDDYYEVLYDAKPPLEDPSTNTYNFSRREGILSAWRLKHPDSYQRVEEFVRDRDRTLGPQGTALAAELRQDREALRKYWVLTDRAVEGKGVEKEWEAYQKEPLADKSVFLAQHRDLDIALRTASLAKQDMRRKDADIERLLMKWEYISSPLNPEVKLETRQRQVKKLRGGGFEVGP